MFHYNIDILKAKFIYVLIFCNFYCLSNLALSQTNPTVLNLDTLAQRLGNDFLKMPQSVGLSIGIYHNGGNYFYNFGTVEKGKALPPTQNTVYEIGSITKTFTSFLLAKAVLEKKVKLTDDIRKYLDGKYPNLQYEGKPIQLLHLANTTSGLPDWLPITPDTLANAHPDSVSSLRQKIYGDYTRKDFYKALQEVKLDTIPGFKPKHSNAAAQLLSYILENVYKTPIEQLINKYILAPYKMRNTSFLASTSNITLLAKGYNGKGEAMPYFTIPEMQSTGGLNACTADLLKYVKLQVDKKNNIIGLSHERTINIDAATNEFVTKKFSELKKGSAYSYGLNWLIYQYENGNTQIWADGGTAGFCSYLVIYPELNSGIVLLANVSDEAIFNKLGGMAYEIFQVIGQK